MSVLQGDVLAVETYWKRIPYIVIAVRDQIGGRAMRLIDADALKKDLKSVTLSNGTLVNTNAVLYLLEEYPTAYDVDKVVEQLGKLKKAEQDRPDDCDEDGYGDGEQIYNDGRSQGRYEAFGKAIEIVKGGGVDG